VESRVAGTHGMAYRLENVFFATMFYYEVPRHLKMWRVYEKWAVKYPPPKQNKDAEKAP
jgi:hypothetical protein